MASDPSPSPQSRLLLLLSAWASSFLLLLACFLLFRDQLAVDLSRRQLLSPSWYEHTTPSPKPAFQIPPDAPRLSVRWQSGTARRDVYSLQMSTGTPPRSFRLAWRDEFEGSELRSDEWDFRSGCKHFSCNKRSAVKVANGSLHLSFFRDDHPTSANMGGVGSPPYYNEEHWAYNYSTGGVVTKRPFKLGYWEVKLNFYPAGGFHNAFWSTTGNRMISGSARGGWVHFGTVQRDWQVEVLDARA